MRVNRHHRAFFSDNHPVDDEVERLKQLLQGTLAPEERGTLETELTERPALRRKLADLAIAQDANGWEQTARVSHALPRPEAAFVEGVDVGATLGQGGMAIVRIGRQLKLDRPVAVKTMRGDRRSDGDVARLLREARITGRLEHPNIVPVHDIVRGEDDVPQVVLKLIEGYTWTELMRDQDRVEMLFGATDLLEWNLDVLMSVTRALSFAHSRGVIHRDVKPANVMLGSFGEVYLLDWGIARDLDDPIEEMEELELAGTTGYMAPEQLPGRTAPLGPWTDTYLLGATLYHVLAGRPPHSGVPLEERVLGETTVAPLPDDVPAELRRIAARALEPDPKQRTQRPEELRLAVATFLQHRSALRLVERGEREQAAAERAQQVGDDSEWERAVVSAELSYRAALDDWKDCEAASRGLDQLTVARIERALAGDDPLAARRLVESHAGLSEELVARVETACTLAANEEGRLRRIVTDLDRGFGYKARGVLGALFGLIWVVFWCVVAFRPPKTVAVLVGFTATVTVVGVTVVLTRAKELLASRLNRHSMFVVLAGLIAGMVWCIGASLLGLEMRVVVIGILLVSAMFTSGMATLMDPWGTVSAVGFTLCFLAACYRPAWTPWAVVVGNVVLIVNQIALSILRPRIGFEKMPKVRLRGRAAKR